jgi:hypothetical protein
MPKTITQPPNETLSSESESTHRLNAGQIQCDQSTSIRQSDQNSDSDHKHQHFSAHDAACNAELAHGNSAGQSTNPGETNADTSSQIDQNNNQKHRKKEFPTIKKKEYVARAKAEKAAAAAAALVRQEEGKEFSFEIYTPWWRETGA